MLIGVPALFACTLYKDIGSSVTTTIKNIRVSAVNNIDNAISLGVFWRLAPSTIDIIRSKKLSPGLTVILTINQSDSTLVPPVTEQKSPPASRITGADSPVIALSSTDAHPSIISPSHGIISPASIKTKSPLRNALPETLVILDPNLGQ